VPVPIRKFSLIINYPTIFEWFGRYLKRGFCCWDIFCVVTVQLQKMSGKKFLISGAGLVGLLIAQAFKQRHIDFIIFDRDESVHFREHAGWAITLHWALENFKSLLPPELVKEIYAAQVLPNFHEKDTGKFIYINAATGKPVVSIPPSKRLRVRREQIRRMLLSGIDVEWGCKLSDISTGDEVQVTCENGKVFKGDVLIGCDGANSTTRRVICPGTGELYQLPVRFCGAKVKMTKEETEAIASSFDPLLFQGTVPDTNTFFWFSVLSTPEYAGDYYAQVNLSWNVPDEEEPFGTAQEKANAMQKHAEGLNPQLKALVDRAVLDPRTLLEIKLADWPAVEWDSHHGSILLAGDAAHAMTMYRGEAGNHGITDAYELILKVDRYLAGEKLWELAATEYCGNVKARAAPAVLLSREACLDAHDFSKIRPDTDSPLLSMRKNTK
jgi:2-polyprenyl-6-methoxyphenol hydroxylase-like FAD-dependent oxidoreductase